MLPNHTVQMMLHLMSLLVPLIARQYSDLPTTTRVEVLLIKKILLSDHSIYKHSHRPISFQHLSLCMNEAISTCFFQ